MRIALFTDLHYRQELPSEAIDPDDSLAAGLAHAVKHGNPDHIVFCGDVTHVGDERSYLQLKERLATLATPYTLLIGNHDRREVFQKFFPDTARDNNGFVQSVMDVEGHRLIFLDTLNAPPYDYPRYHMGHLCEARLNWLSDQLAGAGDRACIIFMHHPPHDTGIVAMDALKLTNGEQFYERILPYNNVKHIICGHVHRTISGSYKGIPFSTFKSMGT